MTAGIICLRSGNFIFFGTLDEAEALIRQWEVELGDDPHDYGIVEFDDDGMPV